MNSELVNSHMISKSQLFFNNLFCLIRIKHWIKNLLVFAALIFSFSFSRGSFLLATLGFISFSFMASSIYVINDIFDEEKDKLHPEKKYRPIASGKIKRREAIYLFLILFLASLLVAYKINAFFFAILIFYLVLNLSYSIKLKNFAIVDVMIVALGFVLRVVAGAFAIKVSVSHWLLLCTFFISLFLAFGKRKIEMLELTSDNKKNHRESITEYTEGFINQMLSISAGISVVFYSLYCIDSSTVLRFKSDNLVYTTPVVVFGVLRYFHLLYNKNDGGDPVNIFIKDIPLITDMLIWIGLVLFIYIFGQ